MRIRYGGPCALVLAASMLTLPLAAQVPVRAGTAQSESVQRRELERARQALEAASQSLGRALDRLGRAGEDTSARAAARAALAEAGRAVDRAQAAYVIQQRRMFEADARRAIRAQVMNAQRGARITARATPQPASQQGWLGIFFSDPVGAGHGERGAHDFPVIVSVEPGSPADHAGIEAGDQLVAIDGHTLGGRAQSAPAETVTRLLHPGARIPVRILRGDATKEMHVLVGRRPGAFSFRVETSGGTGNGASETVVTAIPPMPPVHAVPTPRPARPARSAAAPAAAVAPSVSFAPAAFGAFYFNGVSMIAGAQLWRVDDLKDYFHVDTGLLVLRVLPGTPAERATLRSGDVIVRADGRVVTSLRVLQHVLERADDRSGAHAVPLDVVRRGKTMHLTVRW